MTDHSARASAPASSHPPAAARPLYDPAVDQPSYIPSLVVAVDQAVRILNRSERVEVDNHTAVLRHAAALDHQLRVVLAALDTELAAKQDAEAGVTGTITPTRPAPEIWSIRELNHLYEQHGGTVTLAPVDASSVRLTLTTADGRTVTTEWETAAEPHGFSLPVYRAYLGLAVAR